MADNSKQMKLPLWSLQPAERRMLDELLADNVVYSWAVVQNRLFFQERCAGEETEKPSVTTLKDFRERNVHDGSRAVFDMVVHNESMGKHRVRLQMRLDSSDWHWWEAIYTVAGTEGDNRRIDGVLMRIDHIVSVEKRIAEAVNKANEVNLRENFIANISHDIRTPLNAISGFAQLLTDDTCDDDERAMYGDIIRTNISQMLSLIDGAVEKSLEETDGMTFKMRDERVQEIVETTYHTNNILAPSHLKFGMECDDSHTDMVFHIDRVRTRQVLNNYISNAFKFTPEGSVTLGWRYEEEKGCVRLYVRDTGIGVSKEARETLLDRFAKVNDGDGGTGLGLDICQKIVKMQGGEIGFDSVEGKGSTFWFTQPVQK